MPLEPVDCDGVYDKPMASERVGGRQQAEAIAAKWPASGAGAGDTTGLLVTTICIFRRRVYRRCAALVNRRPTMRFVCAITVIFSLLLVAEAAAAVVTFEGLSGPNGSIMLTGVAYVESGFAVTPVTGRWL